ncbi:TonB-dependent receptor [Marinobacterium zhoushanense]|uniref:TonB-dependent receptor n=1 Tax=Marinobacterium zhoushanense TaxID=1679163 RepID=A0ABQ1KI94_9GAMM|nr:TonB-dependent siderophore receptor [Marinobacterium zhoushanense]GGB96698.1 TonB-dependent receptor [Marinobacterium zhoushanense]
MAELTVKQTAAAGGGQVLRGSVTMAGTLTFAISTAMMGSVHAEEVALDTLLVEDGRIAADANPYAEPEAPYKAKSTSDKRRVREIADTPQTMTVLTKDSIEDSGKTELKDILSAQPGITLGTGEGGNSFGDRYIIRGYEARSDVFTDGLREPGLISRETFALEQVEISKGPSSTFAGRGSTGGAVNTVTKKASMEDDFVNLQAGLGSDDYKRYTVDANKAVTSDLGVRANVLYTEADTPDRAPAGERRNGILLSGVYQPGRKTLLSADFYHFRGDDRTDPGYGLDRDSGEFDKYDYVGQNGLDFQRSEADILTFTVEHDFGRGVELQNKTRIGETVNEYIVTAYSARRADLRSFTGWQENAYLGNQTNLILDKELFGKRNTIVAGIEFAKEGVDAGSYIIDTTSSFTIDPYNADNGLWAGSVERSDATRKLDLKTLSAYLMDTVTLSDDWEVFAGLRYDYFDYSLDAIPRGETTFTNYEFSDGFLNGHLGVVYSPWEHGNVYASWSTSSNINGGEADAGTSCGYGGLCADSDGNYAQAEPEQSTNLELGTKWNLMDEKLLLTAALFRTTKDDVIEGGSDSYVTGGTLNTGKNRVEGLELGLSGNITPKLSAQIGVAIMESETLESYDPENVGKPKANFAEKSGNAQLRYQLTPKFAFGGVATYSSEIFGGQPDAGASGDIELPDYTVYDLFASYQISPQLSLRANVQNVTDEEYYTAVYRGGSIVYLGDARSANLTLNYKF